MSDARRLILAFDFGLKRIGVATANLLTRTASPLTTLAAPTGPPWDDIDGLLADWHPDLIVVGHPGPDATPALLAALDEFLAQLAQRQTRPIEQVDESFTSAAASAEFRAARSKGLYNRRLTKPKIDSRAACLIAEQWMNEALERD
jgi:putative Holliday junction resolvase